MNMKERMEKAGMGFKNYTKPYAIEIEAEFKENPSPGLPSFKRHHDPSLINGIEYVSDGPRSLNTLKQEVLELLSDEAFTYGYSPSPRSSIHVHCNILTWTYDELMVVLGCYYLVEGLLFDFVDRGRRGNLYCMPLYEADGAMKVFDDLAAGEFGKINGYFNDIKYSALNVACIPRLGTIEFRHLEGTNDYRRINRWLDIIHNICETRKAFKDLDEVLRAFDRDREAFVVKVLGDMACRNVYEVTDLNYSHVFYISCAGRRVKRLKKQDVVYKFPSERELDDLERGMF